MKGAAAGTKCGCTPKPSGPKCVCSPLPPSRTVTLISPSLSRMPTLNASGTLSSADKTVMASGNALVRVPRVSEAKPSGKWDDQAPTTAAARKQTVGVPSPVQEGRRVCGKSSSSTKCSQQSAPADGLLAQFAAPLQSLSFRASPMMPDPSALGGKSGMAHDPRRDDLSRWRDPLVADRRRLCALLPELCDFERLPIPPRQLALACDPGDVGVTIAEPGSADQRCPPPEPISDVAVENPNSVAGRYTRRSLAPYATVALDVHRVSQTAEQSGVANLLPMSPDDVRRPASLIASHPSGYSVDGLGRLSIKGGCRPLYVQARAGGPYVPAPTTSYVAIPVGDIARQVWANTVAAGGAVRPRYAEPFPESDGPAYLRDLYSPSTDVRHYTIDLQTQRRALEIDIVLSIGPAWEAAPFANARTVDPVANIDGAFVGLGTLQPRWAGQVLPPVTEASVVMIGAGDSRAYFGGAERSPPIAWGGGLSFVSSAWLGGIVGGDRGPALSRQPADGGPGLQLLSGFYDGLLPEDVARRNPYAQNRAFTSELSKAPAQCRRVRVRITLRKQPAADNTAETVGLLCGENWAGRDEPPWFGVFAMEIAVSIVGQPPLQVERDALAFQSERGLGRAFSERYVWPWCVPLPNVASASLALVVGAFSNLGMCIQRRDIERSDNSIGFEVRVDCVTGRWVQAE